MKSLFAFLISLFAVSLIQAQTWTWSPDRPKTGDLISLHVNDVDLQKEMHIVSFSFQGKDLITTDIHYMIQDDEIQISFPMPSGVNWIRFVIKDNENQVIAGDQRIVMNESAPAQSGLIEEAFATSTYYRPMGLKRDEAAATSLFREATQANPDWLQNPDVLRSYYFMAKAAGAEEDLNHIKTTLLTVDAKNSDASADLLMSAVRISKDMGDTILQQSLRKKLDKADPKSFMSQEDQLTKFNKSESPEEKIAIRSKFKSTYTINAQNQGILDQMTSSIVEEFAAKEDWAKAESYINEIINPLTKASVCNNYAWTLAGEGIDHEASNIEVASRLSLLSINSLSPDAKKPATLSKMEWEKNLDFSRAMYGDTYALVLFKEGKYNEALDHQAFAVKTSDYNDIEMNERYVIYLDKAGRKDDLLSFVDEMIESGKASEKMKEMHKQVWTKEKTTDQLYNQYVIKLEARAKEKRLQELQATWMDAPAPDFTLKNMKGEEVSLSDYKGKTVVLDFWATWCGPCKASFPGMKNIVEHYAQEKDVAFLFIDTWEKGEGIPERVNTFINDNHYPFYVLMDEKNQVVANYKVEGIPTKFIIDKNQKVRFKSVGYGGNNEVLVQELITMIEMAQNGGKLQKS